MKKALISETGEVVDVQAEAFEVHPSLTWIDCDDSVETGDFYKDGEFTRPPVATPDYRYQRRAEYPPIGDQLDALWKGGAEAEAMLARIQEIKSQYPKP
jgi:hypothetical protein